MTDRGNVLDGRGKNNHRSFDSVGCASVAQDDRSGKVLDGRGKNNHRSFDSVGCASVAQDDRSGEVLRL